MEDLLGNVIVRAHGLETEVKNLRAEVSNLRAEKEVEKQEREGLLARIAALEASK
jgi:hypothetical protein